MAAAASARERAIGGTFRLRFVFFIVRSWLVGLVDSCSFHSITVASSRMQIKRPLSGISADKSSFVRREWGNKAP